MRIGSNKGSEVEAYTDFIKEAEGLKSTLRTAWTAEGRQESTAEHSWRLALFAGVMCREFPELDREKVLMMCLVHDLGERYSGDISAALRPDAGDKLNQEREDGVDFISCDSNGRKGFTRDGVTQCAAVEIFRMTRQEAHQQFVGITQPNVDFPAGVTAFQTF